MDLTIAIDGIAVSHPQPGGYKTYATNLVRHLAAEQGGLRYRLLVDRPLTFDLPANWLVEPISSGRGGVRVAWREQVSLPRWLARSDVTFLHSLCATGPLLAPVPVLVTIHDVIEFTEPLPSLSQARRYAMRIYSRFVQARLAARARSVITGSAYSKRQIIARFHLPPEQVSVIHNAPSAVYRPLRRRRAVAKSLARWDAADHILALASAAPRKNIAALMQSYALLPEHLKARHPLLLVCSHRSLAASLVARAERLGLTPHLRLAEGVTDEQLLCLYNAAALFAFLSLEEGFGLPPLEAMACGTPVVASNTSSLPEVLGEAAVLVPPLDTQAIAHAMEEVLTSPALHAELMEAGLERSQHFTWENTARQTAAVYRSMGGR